MVLISEKTEVLDAEPNERAEAATGNYSVTGDSLQYIYSVPVSKNHRNIRSRCLVLWLLPFYMVVATYLFYEKVRSRTMRTAIVSNLFNSCMFLSCHVRVSE